MFWGAVGHVERCFQMPYCRFHRAALMNGIRRFPDIRPAEFNSFLGALAVALRLMDNAAFETALPVRAGSGIAKEPT
jgi:hypothetical protein